MSGEMRFDRRRHGKHVEVYRITNGSTTLNPIDDDVRTVRFTRRGVRLTAEDGTITFIPWAVVSRVKVTKASKP